MAKKPAEKPAVDLNFIDEVIRQTPGDSRLKNCIQCGTCSASCPYGIEMDYSPRRLFAMTRAGMKEQVLTSNTPWFCVSCYYCMARCPQKVKITDIMYTLKRMATKAGTNRTSELEGAPEFSETFTDFVESYGRNFELGLAIHFLLRYHPLVAMKLSTSLGVNLLKKGRMALKPDRIKGIKQLRAILEKAKELGGNQ